MRIGPRSWSTVVAASIAVLLPGLPGCSTDPAATRRSELSFPAVDDTGGQAVGRAGSEVAGVDPAGVPAVGVDASGFDAAGVDSAGDVHGVVEEHDGLRVLRLWGSAEQRGYAHGWLLANDICEIMRKEFAARFAAAPQLLAEARRALPRLIAYPETIDRELAALWRGVTARGADRDMPELGREFDEVDLRVANALDVFGLMGCSSFTVWGDRAQGGGVLTARNFDWPLTGEHMLDGTLLIVQVPDDGETKGWASASVAWPGYVGSVTGISASGVATFLHVGSAKVSLPQPESWPSAIATRVILETCGSDLQRAAEAIEYTSPPVGFLTHVVLPSIPAHGSPAALFETDAHEVVVGDDAGDELVVTNHFRTRTDGRRASRNSEAREQTLQGGIAGCFETGDRVVDVDEAWRMLESVEVKGRSGFGTLHSLVYRHDPWCFELRVAQLGADQKVVGAPSSSRRHRLTPQQVFGDRFVPGVAATADTFEGRTFQARATADGRWRFTHPDGTEVQGRLWIPAGENVRVVVSADDALAERGAVALRIADANVSQSAFAGRYQVCKFALAEAGEHTVAPPLEDAPGTPTQTGATVHVVDAARWAEQPWREAARHEVPATGR